MIILRKSAARGYAQHGWLESYHSFSFAEYFDEAYMGYSVLRVINEDKIAATTGFGMHSHHDMEIITYMIAGELTHQDSMGNTAVIRAGDVQYMSAGTGVRHSEVNASHTNTAYLLQIWITPAQTHLTPTYAQLHFLREQKLNRWCQIVSALASEYSIRIQQDMSIEVAILESEKTLQHSLQNGRCAYLQVVSGIVQCNGELLQAGDAAQIEAVAQITLQAQTDSEFLWFDLPKVH